MKANRAIHEFVEMAILSKDEVSASLAYSPLVVLASGRGRTDRALC